MENEKVIVKQKKTRKLKIILWVFFFPLFFIPIFVGAFTDIFGAISLISLLLGIISLLIIIYLSENYYKWPLVLFIIFYIGLMFKKFHWPFAGIIITTSTLLLSLVSLVTIIKYLFNLRNNQFLKWFGIAAAFITMTIMSGWVIMIQHWSRDLGTLLGYIGSILLIITVLAMVFTLPNSNYIGWTALERKQFFRVVLIPLLLIFFITALNLVFPKAWTALMDFNSIRWNLKGIELLDLEGIPKL